MPTSLKKSIMRTSLLADSYMDRGRRVLEEKANREWRFILLIMKIF